MRVYVLVLLNLGAGWCFGAVTGLPVTYWMWSLFGLAGAVACTDRDLKDAREEVAYLVKTTRYLSGKLDRLERKD